MSTQTEQVSLRQLLRQRNFFLLWLGQGISALGDAFTRLAIPIAIFDLTGSKLHLGLAVLSGTVASALFGVLAGALVDRWDRKRTMLWTDLVRGGVVLAIPLLILSPLSIGLRLAGLYVLQFALTALGRLFTPAKVSLLPELVSRDELMTANSVELATTTGVEFLGYAAAGALIGVAGVQTAFLVDAASFWISALFIFGLRVARQTPVGDANFHQVIPDVVAGLKFVQSRASLLLLMGVSFFAPVVIGFVNPLLLPFVLEKLNSDSFGYGLFEGLFALGATAGSLWAGGLGGRLSPTRLVALGVAGMGALLTFTFLSPSLAGLVQPVEARGALTLALGLALPLFLSAALFQGWIFVGLRTSVQQDVPGELIGRVWSTITIASSVGMSLGAFEAGLGDLIDVQVLLVSAAVLLTALGLAAWSLADRVTWQAGSDAVQP